MGTDVGTMGAALDPTDPGPDPSATLTNCDCPCGAGNGPKNGADPTDPLPNLGTDAATMCAGLVNVSSPAPPTCNCEGVPGLPTSYPMLETSCATWRANCARTSAEVAPTSPDPLVRDESANDCGGGNPAETAARTDGPAGRTEWPQEGPNAPAAVVIHESSLRALARGGEVMTADVHGEPDVGGGEEPLGPLSPAGEPVVELNNAILPNGLYQP